MLQFRKLITHDNCADGLASAMIVKGAQPDVEIAFVQHGQPSLEQLQAEPGLLFCDITPPRSRVQDFIDAGAIVLDHHKHARDIVEAFGDRGIFADELAEPGVSGAVLAYRHVYLPAEAGEDLVGAGTFARLIGIRDTWQKHSPEWDIACDLSMLLLSMPRSHWLDDDHWETAIQYAVGARGLELGRAFREQRMVRARQVAQDGTLAFFDGAGREWRAFPDPAALTSDIAELLRERGHPLACGWFQTVDGASATIRTVLSFRSDGSVDVGELAKRYGGGGHSRAAGCTLIAGDSAAAIAQSLISA